MLVRLGYRVIGLSSSTEVLALFQSAPERFNLVITDQTMPGITGSAFATEVLKIRPDTPIILMTGYSETITLQEALALGKRGIFRETLYQGAITCAIQRCLKGTEKIPYLKHLVLHTRGRDFRRILILLT